MSKKNSKPIYELIDIYCDGPNLQELAQTNRNIVRGYTFNPTLFRSLGVINYYEHCCKLVKLCKPSPISLEVLADDKEGMIRQAQMLNGLGDNIYVKIPITFTSGETTFQVIKALVQKKVKLNITAVFTKRQVDFILPTLRDSNSIISVFAGRLFDIGVDATVATGKIAKKVHAESNCRVLWASSRMIHDAKSAYKAGCDIITMKPALIKKISLFEKTPESYSLDTVRMFHNDATSSGYTL